MNLADLFKAKKVVDAIEAEEGARLAELKAMRGMTQCERIIHYINEFGSISTYEAFNDLGVTRLASRINDLVNAGYVFDKTMETKTNRFGQKVSYVRYKFAPAVTRIDWRRKDG